MGGDLGTFHVRGSHRIAVSIEGSERETCQIVQVIAIIILEVEDYWLGGVGC